MPGSTAGVLPGPPWGGCGEVPGSGGALDSRVDEGRKERQRKPLADSGGSSQKLPESTAALSLWPDGAVGEAGDTGFVLGSCGPLGVLPVGDGRVRSAWTSTVPT